MRPLCCPETSIVPHLQTWEAVTRFGENRQGELSSAVPSVPGPGSEHTISVRRRLRVAVQRQPSRPALQPRPGGRRSEAP